MDIKIKYDSGTMEIHLNELFYYPTYRKKMDDWNTVHYSKMQRISKLFKFFHQERWGNEQSIKLCLGWLNTEKGKWIGWLKIASENFECQRVGSPQYIKYKSEVNSCDKFVKLFTLAIRILNEGR